MARSEVLNAVFENMRTCRCPIANITNFRIINRTFIIIILITYYTVYAHADHDYCTVTVRIRKSVNTTRHIAALAGRPNHTEQIFNY